MFLLPAYLTDWKLPSTYHVRTYLARVTLYLSRSAVGLRPSVGLTVPSLSFGFGRTLHLLPVTLARHVDVVSGLVEGVHAAQVAAILGQLPGGAA